MAAAYLNKTIAHIEGGDVTGSIDESVRHAITKLAHIHFVTNDDAQRRVLAMGEDPRYVFNTGSLDVELASQRRHDDHQRAASTATASATTSTSTQPFLMVIQHPVTTERDNRAHLETTLRAVAALDMPTIWFWPNPDAGTGEMADSLRHFREQHPDADRARCGSSPTCRRTSSSRCSRTPSCLVGNSSAGIKECSFLGTPVVNIGARQQGRLTAEHVDARRLRRGRDRRARRDAAGARPLRAVAHLLPSRRQPGDRRRARRARSSTRRSASSRCRPEARPQVGPES